MDRGVAGKHKESLCSIFCGNDDVSHSRDSSSSRDYVDRFCLANVKAGTTPFRLIKVLGMSSTNTR